MSSTPIGCFSWLCGGKPKKATKSATINEKGKAPQVVPTTGDYAFEASKQTIEILQKFGDALPIPCANQVLEIGLLLLTTYEEVTAVEQQVKELNNRIGALMLVMVDQLNGKDAKSISPEVVRDIERLGSDLQVIRQNLDQIAAQNRLLLVFFKNANKSAIDDCLGRLKDSLQTFQVARAIEGGNMLFDIQGRLKEMDKTTKKIAEKVDKMYDWLQPKDGHNAQDPVLEIMPAIPHLHGRDAVISDIITFITTNSSPRVGIIGAGGMGKTSVAVSVMNSEMIAQKYGAAHRFWVPCLGVTSPLVFIRILSKSLRVSKESGNPLKDLLDTLTSSSEPRLLLLDNLETALDVPEVVTDSGPLSSEGVLNQLASISHVSILVTIRSNRLRSQHINWQLFPLHGVAQEDARAIFTDICPEAKDDSHLDPLLEALGYMPYAVTLMANQAADLDGVQLKDLLNEWKKSGPNALSDDIRLKMNRSIELSIKSRPMEDPDVQQVLAILSKLPSGTSQQNLTRWASSVQHPLRAIGTLKRIALVTHHQERDSPTLFILPVLQSYLQEDPYYNSAKFRGLVLKACCGFIHDHKSSPGDQNFKADLDALAFEQVNIQAILLSVTAKSSSELNIASSTVFEAMVAFSWFQCWTRPSVELLKHMLEIAGPKAVGKDRTTAHHIAEAHLCLGRMYFQLCRYSDAGREFEIAHDHFHKLGNLALAGKSTLGIYDTLGYNWPSPGECLRIIQRAQIELQNDRAGSARALIALGDYHWSIRERQRSLEVLRTAQTTLEELGCFKDVVDCLYIMARCYHSSGELEQCLKTCERGLEVSKQVGLNDDISRFLHVSANCYIRLQNYDEALELLKENLAITETVGDPGGMGYILLSTGYVLAVKGEYTGARIAYSRAIKEYSLTEMVPQTISRVEMCERNLQLLESGEEGLILEAPRFD